MSKHFEECLAFTDYNSENGVVKLVVFLTSENYGFVVLREFFDDCSGRRNYGHVLAILEDEEYAVVVIVLQGSVCKALDESKSSGEFVAAVSKLLSGGDCCVLCSYGRIVFRNDPVLLGNGPVVFVNGVIYPVQCAVVGDTAGYEFKFVCRSLEPISVRRT